MSDNYPVDAALAEARKAIYLEGNDHEWATPVLFSRSPDNRILEIPQAPSAIHKAPILFHVPFLHNDNFVGRDDDLGTRHAAAVAATLQEQWDDLGAGDADAQTAADARLLLRVAGQLGEAAQIPVARLGLLAGVSALDDGFFGTPLDAALKLLEDASLIEELQAEQLRLHPLVREFAANQTPAAEASTFRAQCVGNLYRAYCDIATLEDHVDRRGVRAVERDIITVLTLLPQPRAPSDESTIASLQSLLILLQRQSHILGAWERSTFSSGLPQQLLYQAQRMKMHQWIRRLCDYFQQKRRSYLELQWHTRQESVSLERTFVGHTSAVTSVAVTPDGQHIVSASHDQTIKVWKLTTTAAEITTPGHNFAVTSVAIMQGQNVVSAAFDCTIKIWSLATGAIMHTFYGHAASINDVVVTQDDQRFVSASDDGTLKLWNSATGRKDFTFRGHTNRVNSVALTPTVYKLSPLPMIIRSRSGT